jgi:hypothetical protein
MRSFLDRDLFVLHTERYIGHVAQLKSHENAQDGWEDEETVPEQDLQDNTVSDPKVDEDEEGDYTRIATGAAPADDEAQPDLEESSEDEGEEKDDEPVEVSDDDDGEDYGDGDDDDGVL